MVDAFSTESAGKRWIEHIQREGNYKQGTADVSRCGSAFGEITIAFLDSAENKPGTLYVFSV